MIANMRAGLLGAALATVGLLAGRDALAHTGETGAAPASPTSTRPPEGPRGRLAVRVAEGGSVLRLRQAEGPFLAASVVVTNVGDGPLSVRRVSLLQGSEGAPRSPTGASASLEKGRDSKLAPGESRGIDVRWRPDLARAKELQGFLEIETDSAAPGADVFDAPALVGVVGDRRSGLGRSVSSALVLLPLLVALLAALAGRVRALGERVLARASAFVFLLHAVLAAAAAVWIDPRLSSLDGNDGMQFVEHVALPGGMSWTVGLDGASVPFLVASTLVILAAAVAGRRVRLHGQRFFAGLSLLATSTAGALVALDVRLTVVFLVLAAPAAYLLVSAGDDPRARRAATGVSAIVLGSAAIAAAALFGLAGAAGPGLDLTLGRTGATWQLAELGRAAWTSESTRLLGMHPATAAWALGVAAFLVRAAALSPLGGALRVAPAAATAALLGCALAPLGLLLVRLGFGPGVIAASSVAPVLFGVGLLVAAAAVAAALRATELTHVAASTVLVQAGLGLVALASRTPQGIEGALAILAWHGLAAALLVLVAASLRDRVGTSDGARLGGLGAEMPRASALAALALLAAGGLPGLAGFWGPALAISGLAARVPLVAGAAVILLLVQAAALARAHARIFGGPVVESWRASKELEPFGGRFPDLRTREMLGALPLAIALLLLGLHPRLLLGASEGRALELHRRVDPAGPTQIADRGPGATFPEPCLSSTSSTWETPSSASDRAS